MYPTYKDACYALGVIDDDREYIEALQEANTWGTPTYLRSLFATLLLTNAMHRPDHVWNKCWELLSDDFLNPLNISGKIPGLC